MGEKTFNNPSEGELLYSMPDLEPDLEREYYNPDEEPYVKKLVDVTVEAMVKLTELWTPLWDAIVESARAVGEAMAAAAEPLLGGLKHSPEWVFILAYIWACDAHPKWVNVLNHTKKRRTRKKYQDRILRAYLEMKNDGEI